MPTYKGYSGEPTLLLYCTLADCLLKLSPTIGQTNADSRFLYSVIASLVQRASTAQQLSGCKALSLWKDFTSSL
jgi:hypothetical protein